MLKPKIKKSSRTTIINVLTITKSSKHHSALSPLQWFRIYAYTFQMYVRPTDITYYAACVLKFVGTCEGKFTGRMNGRDYKYIICTIHLYTCNIFYTYTYYILYWYYTNTTVLVAYNDFFLIDDIRYVSLC